MTSPDSATADQTGTLGRAASNAKGARPPGIILGIVGMAVVAWVAINLFLALAFYPGWFFNSKPLIAMIGVAAGLGAAYVLFYFLNMFVNSLPRRLSQGLIPYAFVLPGLGFIALMLIYPTVQTVNYSFANADSTRYVGLQNYSAVFSDRDFWVSLTNNALWLLVVPAVTVGLGVMVAVLADKLSATGEKVAKSFIFLPMAISFVGASAIWNLVYEWRPDDAAQTGLLNAIWTGLGGEPQPWLNIDTARLNSFLLMVILIWLQAGFAMILLSGAIKAVPEDTLEAARIDGANERAIFFRIVLPQIKGTVITVFVTVLILVLKVFDIVYVTTNGRDDTNVIANLFFNILFFGQDAGRASAIVVVLLILILPVLIYQVRAFREEQAA
ncbi:MAG: carbohydrate ABC transporter permease [Beutenbergiaceae bacterium]